MLIRYYSDKRVLTMSVTGKKIPRSAVTGRTKPKKVTPPKISVTRAAGMSRRPVPPNKRNRSIINTTTADGKTSAATKNKISESVWVMVVQ